MGKATTERTVIAVSWPVKARLNGLRLDMQQTLRRHVTFGEVMEMLLAEHDKHVHKEAGA